MNNLDQKFVSRSFRDGDFEYSPPKWRQIIDDLILNHSLINHDEERAQDDFIKPDEVALKHPQTGAIVRLRDDGCIDIFAGDQLGIRLDPQTNSINLFGERINFFGGQIHFRSKPNGLIWNGYSLNPELYYETDQEKELTLKGSKKAWVFDKDKGWHWAEKDWTVRPFVPSNSPAQYSKGMLEILQELGLPVEKE